MGLPKRNWKNIYNMNVIYKGNARIIMKKAALIMGIIFLVLTFAGGGYVFIKHGQINAGYAVIPGLWTVICFGYYRKKKE